jgi:hypothetical protein
LCLQVVQLYYFTLESGVAQRSLNVCVTRIAGGFCIDRVTGGFCIDWVIFCPWLSFIKRRSDGQIVAKVEGGQEHKHDDQERYQYRFKGTRRNMACSHDTS